MSKKSNPTAIGAFVVGAVVLIATAFVLFGGSRIFATKDRYVAYFDEPTNGLRVGANVLLNGVRIGYVKDIDLLLDEVNFDTTTQVTLEILPENYIMTREGRVIGADMSTVIDHDTLILQAGLRATLAIESFVTGQLRVELVLRPETMPVMVGVDTPYPEIPTITSNIQELLDRVQNWFTDMQENVDFGALSRQLTGTLEGIEDLATSPDLRRSLAGINQLVNDEDTQQLSASLQLTLERLRETSADASRLFRDADAGVDVLTADLQGVLRSLNAALGEAEQTLAAAKVQLRGDSEQFYQLRETLDELQRAAKAVREFFDYVERNPEALLRGKQE